MSPIKDILSVVSPVVPLVVLSLVLLTACSDNKHQNSFSSNESSHVASSSVSSTSLTNTSLSSDSSVLASSSRLTSSSSSTPISPYAGQWRASAYGYVVSISVEQDVFTVKTFNVTSQYCLLHDVSSGLHLDDVQEEFIYSGLTTEQLLQHQGEFTPAIIYEKLEQLPTHCEQNLQTLKTDTGYTFNASNDFEIFWQTFNELYISFDLRGVNWDETYQGAMAYIDDVQDEESLFYFLSEVIAPLGDDHVILLNAPLTLDLTQSLDAALSNDDTNIFSRSTRLNLDQKLLNEYIEMLEKTDEFDGELTNVQIAEANTYIADNSEEIANIILTYAEDDSEIKVGAAGEIAWFKARDNIGYIFIDSMSDYAEGISTAASSVDIAEVVMSEILNDFEDTEGLILDVRFNDGGEDEVSLAIARHFINEPRVVYSKFAGKGALEAPKRDVTLTPKGNNPYLKPTAVLISGDTASAAEIFTLSMAGLPQVKIIGEPTAGAFSDILIKRLTGDIVFGLTNETYLDPQGNNYELIGVPADITVPFATKQAREAGRDNGLDTAIDWINSGI